MKGNEMKDNIMVSVLISTYNHEEFIRDAIEGALNQKVNFKYELIIHDDASTDQTAEIIRTYEKKYPHIIKPILQKENQTQQGRNINTEYIFPSVRGKYIAFCNGDDYWTDENKLQLQVDFLETHPDYSMCIHNAVRLNYETGEEKLLDTFPEDGVYGQEEQILAGLGTNFPASASYVQRTDLLKDIPEFFLASRVLDYPIRQYYANCGKIWYFKKPMSVYRVSTPTSYMKKTAQNQLFYNQYILEMISFFEKLNDYTEKRFWNILKYRLASDYFGFCSSIAKDEGMKKAMENGLDMRKIEKCYQCVDLNYIDGSIRQLCKQTDHLFIYGTSRLAMICKEQLSHAGIGFEGFVVSDDQMKADALEDKKVYYLSEVLEQYERMGFILAVQPVNVNVIAGILENHGITNYCKPYKIMI